MTKRVSVQQFFPCVPELMSWEDWNANMIIYYGQQNVMFAPEENWQAAAKNIAAMEMFGVYPVPSPDTYDEWQAWAKDFTQIINGPAY